MFTYQMVGLADQNNRTYISEYGLYNKKDGFILSDYAKLMGAELLINDLLHKDCWLLDKDKQKPKKMTKEEIEKELGYEIEIEGFSEDNPLSIFDQFLGCF